MEPRQGQAQVSAEASVYIGAGSPLIGYKPERNGPAGYGWVLDDGGVTSCQGQGTFSLQLDNFYSTSSYGIRVGIDGTMETGSASSGSVSLKSNFGPHSVRLEASVSLAAAAGGGGQFVEGDLFQFMGLRAVTQLAPNGQFSNTTLDDASPEITYTGGFATEGTKQSAVPAIQSGDFYEDTLSYTTSAGATATFNFQGCALYIFGPTGPSFGLYSITLDSTSMGTFNASSTVTTYHTLLYFTTQLDPGKPHTLVMRNELEGGTIALDYVVIASPGDTTIPPTTNPNQPPAGPTSPSPVPVPAPVPTQSPQPTFPVSEGGRDGESDATGAIVGGIIGAILFLLLLWLIWRYRQYRKNGGQGDFCTALFGACCRPKKVVEQPKVEKFPIWPMISSKPKYAR